MFVAIGLVCWLSTAVYIVAPDERGVVLRFGRVVHETNPGPHLKLPWPVDEVDAEALMLTGDEHIVKLDFLV